MESTQQPIVRQFSAVLLVAIALISLFAGGMIGYLLSCAVTKKEIDNMQNQLATLEEQVSNLNPTYQNVTYLLGENVSLAQLYDQVKDSVVIIRGWIAQYDFFYRLYYTEVQGSGFVYNLTGQEVAVTNYHVVQGAINITVTPTDGNAYPTTVLGSDPYEDLAVLSTDSAQSEIKTVAIGNSSALRVGDPVIAVGTPYGLAGSMTIGVVSALGRTITEDMTGGYPIAGVIQTSTPINPGNSGGPLLNYQGEVVGITTAIVSDSQGLGFAIPSNTILREIESLVANGSYDKHPWLGAAGTDMTYDIAKAMGANVTYGWLIGQVTSSGPADNAGIQVGTKQVLIGGEWVTVGGDIIIAINGTRIKNLDDLSTYLEENTRPDQNINVTIIRDNQEMNVLVKLGKRPQ